MFSIFQRKTVQEDQLKKGLFCLLAEMEENIELYYVMDQRRFITGGFVTGALKALKESEMIVKHESIRAYAKSLDEFNQAFREFKEFEGWYSQDIERRSQDNARKLNALKEFLDAKLDGMEAVIIHAGQDLEREMIKAGLLKI
ncbi:MAG: hypothetical protein HQL13_03970 [Candidatus Omnitrophica bacterium]|nr:hypothetical protein [Candidatus Omnitrophota bacterium]